MIQSTHRRLIVGLDIGTAKVAVLIGEISCDGIVNIIGMGHCPSRGIEKGNINNLTAISECVKYSVEQAENMANCKISSVHLAVSGKYIHCQNEIGILPIAEKEVTHEDIENIIHIASSVRIENNYRILHVVPQDYIIDNQEGIKNPIGFSGIRMQVQVHLITCHNDIATTLIKVVEHCGLKVDQLIFSGLASNYAVSTETERELGVCVVDIGGGTMDIVIYTNGILRYTKTVPYAGNIVTNDIAYAFNISLSEAEMIKIKYGYASELLAKKNNNIDISHINGKCIRNLHIQNLTRIIEPRYIELMSLIHNEIIQLQKKLQEQEIQYNLSSGIVLTGGATLINGLMECAKKVFHTYHVRIGQPNNIIDITNSCAQEPYYSTSVGLLHYGKEFSLKNRKHSIKYTSIISTWIHRFNNWLHQEF